MTALIWHSKEAVVDGFFLGSSAQLSECGVYRTKLRRLWAPRLPVLVVCMLNPSTADHQKNDPTILTLMHFARLWGFGGLLVVNLYALRTSSPGAMMADERRYLNLNREAIEHALVEAKQQCGRVLVAWGNDGDFEGEAAWFAGRAQYHRIELICLGKTGSGAPKHPMARGKHRIPRDQQPIVWRAVA